VPAPPRERAVRMADREVRPGGTAEGASARDAGILTRRPTAPLQPAATI